MQSPLFTVPQQQERQNPSEALELSQILQFPETLNSQVLAQTHPSFRPGAVESSVSVDEMSARFAMPQSFNFCKMKSGLTKGSRQSLQEKSRDSVSLSSSHTNSSNPVLGLNEADGNVPTSQLSPSPLPRTGAGKTETNCTPDGVPEECERGCRGRPGADFNFMRPDSRACCETPSQTKIVFLAPTYVFEPGFFIYTIVLLWVLLLLLMLCGSLFVASNTKLVGAAKPALVVPLLLIRFLRLMPQSVSYASAFFRIAFAPVIAIVAIVLYAVFVPLNTFNYFELLPKLLATENVAVSSNTYMLSHLSSIIVLAAGLVPLDTAFHYSISNEDENKTQNAKENSNPLTRSNLGECTGSFRVREEELSSILLTAAPSTMNLSAPDLSRRPPTRQNYSSARVGFEKRVSNSENLSPATLRITSIPQDRSVTILFLAYRDTRCTHSKQMFDEHSLYDEMGACVTPRFSALADAASALTKSHGSFFLTAYKDVVGLVWGALPMSVDPALQAVGAGLHILRTFVPPVGIGNEYCALVGAVVHSSQAVIRTLGVGAIKMVHFLSGEYCLGEQLLQRGILLRSFERNGKGKKITTTGLMLDSSVAHLGVSQFLCRPVGIVPLPTLDRVRDESESALHMYTVIYDYAASFESHEDLEWHLAAREREQRSAAFRPLADAALAFYQGDLKGARAVIKEALKGTEDPLMQLVLTDINYIATKTNMNVF